MRLECNGFFFLQATLNNAFLYRQEKALFTDFKLSAAINSYVEIIMLVRSL